MNPKCFQMLSVRVRLFGLAQSGPSQCGIEAVFQLLHHEKGHRCGSAIPCTGLLRRFQCREVIAGEEARLKFSDPIITFQRAEVRFARHASLEGTLRELTVVERTELPALTTQHANQREGRGNSIQKEPESLHEL